MSAHMEKILTSLTYNNCAQAVACVEHKSTEHVINSHINTVFMIESIMIYKSRPCLIISQLKDTDNGFYKKNESCVFEGK